MRTRPETTKGHGPLGGVRGRIGGFAGWKSRRTVRHGEGMLRAGALCGRMCGARIDGCGGRVNIDAAAHAYAPTTPCPQYSHIHSNKNRLGAHRWADHNSEVRSVWCMPGCPRSAGTPKVSAQRNAAHAPVLAGNLGDRHPHLVRILSGCFGVRRGHRCDYCALLLRRETWCLADLNQGHSGDSAIPGTRSAGARPARAARRPDECHPGPFALIENSVLCIESHIYVN